MSISMEPFASEGHFATYDPCLVAAAKTTVFKMQCRSCGFEPDGDSTPKLCPKCHSKSWERYTRPGSLLANADRY